MKTIVICGKAGTGKTRLWRKLCSESNFEAPSSILYYTPSRPCDYAVVEEAGRYSIGALEDFHTKVSSSGYVKTVIYIFQKMPADVSWLGRFLKIGLEEEGGAQ